MTNAMDRLCAAAVVGVTLLGCAKLEKAQPAVVQTSGAHALTVGQTLMLSASTSNGTDSSYAWASSAPAVATVDAASGLVAAVAPGETTITATGHDTGAVGNHPLVVVAAPQDLSQVVPYYDLWLKSGHADITAEPFNHWNADGKVPVECARCHSAEGFIDYLGGDGTTPFKVDNPAPVKSLITCRACHNSAADQLSQVTFPSGVTITGLGGEARCMTCHQGRASGKDVDTAITTAGVMGADDVSPMLQFTNIHYFPAAATLYASRVGGGYQYPGQVYDARFRHVPGFDTCIGCHDPHSTQPRFDQCIGCHPSAKDVDGAHQIRMMSSFGRDYDGDGDVSEGIYGELVGLRDKVLAAMIEYGHEKNTPLCNDLDTYPYWFIDGNGDGKCSGGELDASNGFKSWTPRLLRAAYNYQMAAKDPGAFAHNAKYIIELLYDSVTDVNVALTAKVDMSRAVREDFGHFDGASEAARHWDANEKVDATCSKCHGGSSGYRFYVQYGATIEVPDSANGLDCATCHVNFGSTFDVVDVASVTFPGGTVVAQPGHDNLCGTCHSGRESRATVDAQIASGKFGFLNVHYLPADAVKMGSSAHVGYEYPGKTYAGPLTHHGGSQCTSCHDPKASNHTFRIADVWDSTCRVCHADANGDPGAIRLIHTLDYDGDGNASESLAAEIAGMASNVLAAMRQVAPDLCYAAGIYPYFFKDPANASCGAGKAVSSNAFSAWTPALMKAAFNYQISQTEPGAYAHNFDYMAELLYDSTVDLGGSVGAMVRP